MSYEEACSPDLEQSIQEIFQHKNIVLTSMPLSWKLRFDEKGMLKLASRLNKPTTIQGMSKFFCCASAWFNTTIDQSVDEDAEGRKRVYVGSPQDLIDSHRAGPVEGKILNALHFPFPHPPQGCTPLEALATDVFAFNSTADSEFCKVMLHPFPFASTSFGIGATYNAHHAFHIDADGFGMYIWVQNDDSCKWLIIATPKCKHGIAGTSLFTAKGFDVDKINTKEFEYKAILLTATMELWAT